MEISLNCILFVIKEEFSMSISLSAHCDNNSTERAGMIKACNA